MSDTSNAAPRRRGRPPGAGKPKIVKAERPNQEPSAVVEPVSEATPDSGRASLRPTLREDPRLAAARRAAEIRGHFQDNLDDGTDRFAAPMAPDGWTYEWKRKSVMGMEDHSHMTTLKRAGWEEVPVDFDADHRSMMPPNWNGNTIERDGLILMMRPSVITEEMRQIELRRARGQVQAKEAQLNDAPSGQFERANKDQSLAKIKKAFEPIAVPRE